MKKISFDETMLSSFCSEKELETMKNDALAAKDTLVNGTGEGNDYIGWVNLPENYDREEFARIKAAAGRIREQSQALVVIGIGGSYLGARAAIEFLKPSFGYENAGGLDIYYAGNQLSTACLRHVIKLIGDRDFSVNVISKSGTTTEPAVAFRVFKELLEKKYGKEGAARRIYATTDKARGALKKLADAEGYETFVVPDDVGGRYSVLTAVGLLPIAAAGCDIDALMAGGQAAREELLSAPFETNMALRYAAYRNYFYRNGKAVEILADYDPSLHYICEWWKQLYGESEGKDGNGLFPASVDLTTDLHSMGQYIQDGPRFLIETVLGLNDDAEPILIKEEPEDLDGLNYLAGKPLSFVNDCAAKGTALAHSQGGVPNSVINIDGRDAFALGELFYFFEFACGVSGYILGVNPFNQPGVESYKKKMFKLLGKPGY
ncbi:MAG: glucose-6-phosphate isomerase [Lachnospiraceae bacterium]|nr:glucose-6-phosphate isomerase [Lachnospiraceae bacterium]